MLYFYEAFNKNGIAIKGDVEAQDEKGVVLYLASKDLIASKITAKNKGGLKFLNFSRVNLFSRLKAEDVIFLVRNLATSIRAGLSVSEALEILINDAKPGLMRDVLTSARSAVQGGQPLSQGFEPYRKHFPTIFIGLLRAGEASSRLDKTLEELSNHLIKEYNLVKKIKSAMVYPAILLAASFLVVVFLLVFVLPRLVKTFAQSGAKLPLITRILLGASSFLVNHIILVGISLGLLISGAIYLKNTAFGKRFISSVLISAPVANNLIMKVALVRFTRTFGSLLASAMPVLDALKISSDAIGNIFYRAAIIDVADKARAGVPLSRALENHKDLFPTLLINLIAVGERTGNLEYVLSTFSNFYDEEVEIKLKDLTTLLEPILLLFMGLIVGTVALSILLPIYSLVGKFS